jgi:hypothetical protein
MNFAADKVDGARTMRPLRCNADYGETEVFGLSDETKMKSLSKKT